MKCVDLPRSVWQDGLVMAEVTLGVIVVGVLVIGTAVNNT